MLHPVAFAMLCKNAAAELCVASQQQRRRLTCVVPNDYGYSCCNTAAKLAASGQEYERLSYGLCRQQHEMRGLAGIQHNLGLEPGGYGSRATLSAQTEDRAR